MGVAPPAQIQSLPVLGNLLLDEGEPVGDGGEGLDAQLDDVVSREHGVELVGVDLQPVGDVNGDRTVEARVVHFDRGWECASEVPPELPHPVPGTRAILVLEEEDVRAFS